MPACTNHFLELASSVLRCGPFLSKCYPLTHRHSCEVCALQEADRARAVQVQVYAGAPLASLAVEQRRYPDINSQHRQQQQARDRVIQEGGAAAKEASSSAFSHSSHAGQHHSSSRSSSPANVAPPPLIAHAHSSQTSLAPMATAVAAPAPHPVASSRSSEHDDGQQLQQQRLPATSQHSRGEQPAAPPQQQQPQPQQQKNGGKVWTQEEMQRHICECFAHDERERQRAIREQQRLLERAWLKEKARRDAKKPWNRLCALFTSSKHRQQRKKHPKQHPHQHPAVPRAHLKHATIRGAVPAKPKLAEVDLRVFQAPAGPLEDIAEGEEAAVILQLELEWRAEQELLEAQRRRAEATLGQLVKRSSKRLREALKAFSSSSKGLVIVC